MSRCGEQNGVYSDKMLAGMVDLVHLCAEWARTPGRKFRIEIQSESHPWEIGNEEAVETVNQALYLKYQDWEFVTCVW